MMNIYLVYQKYNKDFTSYAKSITRNEDRALDLVQEAYVAALEKEEIFANMNEYQIKGWFFTTIKNKNIDNIRKQSRLTYLENDEVFDATDSFEKSVVVRELLDKLPEKNRRVLLLKYEMNLNSNEIGKILGISPSTVRSRLSASLKILRGKL
jgi:RNA polymerase sigma-70 factor (ECF subfamily)